MAVNKLVNIKVPILEALRDMGIDHGKNVPDLIRWAVRAEREIGSYHSLNREIKVLEIDKYRAELPCEAMYVQSVFFGDHGCACHSKFESICACSSFATFLNNDVFVVGSFLETGHYDILRNGCSWEIQDNHIVFNRNLDKQKVTVRYLAQCTDEDGFPMVMEGHLDAIIAFIMWKFSTRSLFTPNKMSMNEVTLFRKDWGLLAAEARADDSILSDDAIYQLGAAFKDPMTGGYGFPL